MSIYRCSILWNQSVMGVGETYWSPDATEPNVAKNLSQLLQLRAQCMFNDQFFVGVRVAIEGAPRSAVSLLPPVAFMPDGSSLVTIPPAGTLDPTAPANIGGQLRAALESRVFFGNNRSSIRYFAGVPRDSIGTEPATINAQGGVPWWKNWRAFVVYAQDHGWQIKYQKLSPEITVYNVVGVVQQSTAGALLGVQINVATAPPLQVGYKIALHGFRAAKGVRAATLNGTWYVASVDNTGLPLFSTIWLRNSQGIDPNAQRFTDKTTLRPVVYGFANILSWNPLRMAAHKRGRPSLAPHGRRSRVPSLDP